MSREVLVTGGTGQLGRPLVTDLATRGFGVRVLSRRLRSDPRTGVTGVIGDLTDGRGLSEAIDGADTIIHCASEPNAAGADLQAADHLLAAARAAGSPHIIYISIVGVDRVPLRYYREKLAVEARVRDSGLPWTIQRATQFHSFIADVARQLSRLPVVPYPAGVRFQPIHQGVVASRLADLAEAPAAGRVPDLGGPQIRPSKDLISAYVSAAGKRRLLLPMTAPGAVMRGYREGGHLSPDHATPGPTFQQYLADLGSEASR